MLRCLSQGVPYHCADRDASLRKWVGCLEVDEEQHCGGSPQRSLCLRTQGLEPFLSALAVSLYVGNPSDSCSAVVAVIVCMLGTLRLRVAVAVIACMLQAISFSARRKF